MKASKKGHTAIVEILLKAGVDLEAKDEVLASYSLSIQIIRMIVN